MRSPREASGCARGALPPARTRRRHRTRTERGAGRPPRSRSRPNRRRAARASASLTSCAPPGGRPLTTSAPTCRMRASGKEPRVSRGVIVGSVVAFVVTVVAVVGVALVAIPAHGGDTKPSGDPAVFVEQVVGYIVADDYASAWGSLYPAHTSA